MACEFKLTRQVEFCETDMAGIMHFSNFFRWMEATEHAFFRSLGISIHELGSDVGWPRVHAECDFKQPLRFEDMVEISLLVREKGDKRIVYTFILRKLNERPVKEIARGTLVAVCVQCDESGKMKGISIPKAIADKIEAAPSGFFS